MWFHVDSVQLFGEDAEVLAWRVHAIEQIPKLGALVLGVLAEVVAVGKEAFLGVPFPRRVAPRRARVELVFLDGVDERRRLEAVAARGGARFLLDFAGDGRLDATYNEAGAEAFGKGCHGIRSSREVVSRVDVCRHRDASWAKALAARWVTTMLSLPLRTGWPDGRIGPRRAQHVDGLGFEFRQMIEVVGRVAHESCAVAFVSRVCLPSRRRRNHARSW